MKIQNFNPVLLNAYKQVINRVSQLFQTITKLVQEVFKNRDLAKATPTSRTYTKEEIQQQVIASISRPRFRGSQQAMTKAQFTQFLATNGIK